MRTPVLHGGGLPVLTATFLAAALATAPVAATARQDDDTPPPASSMPTPPSRALTMSVGTGQLVRLPRPMTGVFVADDKIADVQVKGPTAVYLFAKGAGITTVYATDKAGAVVWSSDVRVGNNLADVGGMLRMAMPEDDIKATPVGGMILLTGTVLGPKDAEEAQHLAELFTGGSVQVLNHLQVATPQQVNLQVKIAEVSRSVAREIGVNLANRAQGNPLFSFQQGTPGTITTNTSGLAANGSQLGQTVAAFQQLAGTTLGIAGHVFGADIIASLQLYENSGQVTTLAEPTLTAMSGETASFLAGGEIPIPQSQGLGAVSVEFKEYGVSLAFTPTVLSAGRIALRVRPEVSQLSDAGAVKLNGFTIPALTTRRAETTVELGSGQSFVIGGLLQNNHNNSVSKAPILGNLPILGALFRSNSFQKSESELVIVVTPYIVKPVDANRIALPTDGYRSPTLGERLLLDKANDGVSGAGRPVPTAAPGSAAVSTGTAAPVQPKAFPAFVPILSAPAAMATAATAFTALKTPAAPKAPQPVPPRIAEKHAAPPPLPAPRAFVAIAPEDAASAPAAPAPRAPTTSPWPLFGPAAGRH